MEFSGQEYWSGLPFPSPGERPDPGIEAVSPASQVDSLLSEPPGKSPNRLELMVIDSGRSVENAQKWPNKINFENWMQKETF